MFQILIIIYHKLRDALYNTISRMIFILYTVSLPTLFCLVIFKTLVLNVIFTKNTKTFKNSTIYLLCSFIASFMFIFLNSENSMEIII